METDLFNDYFHLNVSIRYNTKMKAPKGIFSVEKRAWYCEYSASEKGHGAAPWYLILDSTLNAMRECCEKSKNYDV